MRDEKRLVAAALIAGALLASTPPAGTRAFAQISDDVVKLGVTNDQASIYSAAGGFGAVIATRMAVEDFGGTVLGKKIEVAFADNQNKPDISVMRDFYVVQVKTPEESEYPWDYYKVIGTVPAEDAALPLSRSECKLVKKGN
jgi:hypothetical protein